MYVWIWRTLPGGTAGKVAGSVLLTAVAVVILFLWVFPWFEDNVSLLSDVTIDQETQSATLDAEQPATDGS